MKVLFATGIYPPDIGGPATYVRNMAAALQARGLEAEVVTYGGEAPPPDPFPVHRVPRSAAVLARYLAYGRMVRRRARGADVVYVQDALSSGLPGWLGARAAGRRVLLKVVGDAAWEVACEAGWTADGFDEFQSRRYGFRVESLRALQRTVARRADGVVVPSRFLQRVVQGWGVPHERIHVVYNSIPEESAPRRPPGEIRARLGLQGRTVAITAGRLLPHKGFQQAVRALAAVGAAVDGVHLVVAGSGPCEQPLRRLVRELRLEHAVTFTGRLARAELAEHLAASDLFVLLSGYEGFSHVLLEAMRAGLPVVASDVGGNPELVEDGVSGRLVRRDQPEEVRDALLALCQDRELRQRLARGARAKAAALTWDATVERTLAVIEGRAHGDPSALAASNTAR